MLFVSLLCSWKFFGNIKSYAYIVQGIQTKSM